MRFNGTIREGSPNPVCRAGGPPAERGWSAILLAGTRAEQDPLAAHFQARMKALVPIEGEPMIGHVVRTLLASPSVGRILILAQDPEMLRSGDMGWIADVPEVALAVSGQGIAESLVAFAGTAAAPWPVLVTTADHPLLTVDMVEYFIRKSSDSDVSLGVVDRSLLAPLYPESRRTWLRFSDGDFTGANLFTARTERAADGLKVLAKAEMHRKNQLKLLFHFGLALALGALTRTLSLRDAVERGGRRFGLRAAAISMPFAEAGIDVDRAEDHALAERILSGRAADVATGIGPIRSGPDVPFRDGPIGGRKPQAAVDESMLPKRPFIYRLGKRARPWFDHVIARSSSISTGPLIDPGEFAWTADLRKAWRTIRAEAEALISDIQAVPPLRIMSPDHGRIAQHDLWKAFFLYGYGYKVDDNCARCPRTAAIVERIPDLNSAFFSILLPGTRIESHVGPTKGLVTCHLGLVVPPNGGCTMHIHDREVGWQEGECLVFDDTYRHEVEHRGDSPRVILLVQVKRPLRAPGRQLADLFLAGMRRSPFVQEARRNMAAWDRAMQAADRPA